MAETDMQDELIAEAEAFIRKYKPLPWERGIVAYFIKDAHELAPEQMEKVGVYEIALFGFVIGQLLFSVLTPSVVLGVALMFALGTNGVIILPILGVALCILALRSWAPMRAVKAMKEEATEDAR